ncbi:MAG: DUF4159 domain-containing protein [Planctomycetes bacterium]|nr:DUF4159 domain-containing protein [Planctomycetota bacterium]
MTTANITRTAIISGIFLFTFNSICPAQEPRVPFNDQAVEAAINKAVQYVLSEQRADGSWEPFAEGGGRAPQTDGPTAMCIYTLVASGISAKDPRIAKALDWLVKPANQAKLTYSTAFRCLAWHAVNKQLDNKYMKNLAADVDLLIKSTENGSYNYVTNGKDKAAGGDNSNSQYGLYGVWTGARAGIEVPRDYWDKCLKRWIACQHADGGWNYYGTIEEDPANENTQTLGSMTVAGIASLFVCMDWLFMDRFVKCQVNTEVAAVKKGLDWMDKNFLTHKSKLLYYLYGVERVGLASGYKYFGTADWYKTGASWLLNIQGGDGTWPGYGGILPNTCYGLLFLIRGRLPVIFNRLEYDGDWNNRPRALANFCRWSEKAFETEANWQIITLKSDVNEWHDAAVLTITGSKEPKFSAADIEKLRTYVNQGGTLFSITECNGAAFSKGIKEFYQKLFPKYELALCGKDHLINTIVYKTSSGMKIYELSNGIRPLAIHADYDLPLAWQQYQVATGKPSFEAAANVVMYVTDKQFKNRASRIWPAEPKSWPAKSIKVARLRFPGNYDPEPLAMQRFSRLMAGLHNIKVDFIPAGPASEPAAASQPTGPLTGIAPAELTDDIKLAVMTGTGGFKLDTADKDALKKWINAGGILLLDATGSRNFTESAKDLATELFGADALLPLPLSSPVYQLKDMTIDKVKYRRATRTRIGGGNKEPRLLAVLKGDRPMVIVSQEDMTGGLVDYASATCDGYEPESAFNITRNLVMYAASAPPASADGATPPASSPAK